MILVIIAAWLAYKRASENGRSGWAWALITAGVFLGVQIVIGAGIGLLIGFGMAAWGWSESTFQDYFWPINFVCLLASFLAIWPLLRWLDKSPPATDLGGPPAPPQF